MHVLIARQSITRDRAWYAAVRTHQLQLSRPDGCVGATTRYERRHSSDILLQLYQLNSTVSSFSVFKGVKIARLPDQELPALCNNSHYESLRSRMHRTSVGNRPLRRWCGERGGTATKLTYRY